MRVQIIGPGAMGLVLAYFLSKKYHVCIKVREGTLKDYENSNVMIDGNKMPLKVMFSEDYCDSEISIVALKSYDLQSIKNVRLNGDVIFIQNGLSHLGVSLGERNFYAVTTWASRKLQRNLAELTGKGYFKVGSLEGKKLDLKFLKDVGINAEWTDNIGLEIYRKAGINAVINTITSLYRVTNIEILSNPFLYYISRIASDEIELLYRKMGMEIDLFGSIRETATLTARNFSSMLQDILYGRRTEIDAITGELLRLSEKNSIEMPINNLLYNAVKSIEGQKG